MRRAPTFAFLIIAGLAAACGVPPFTEISATPRSAHEPSLAAFPDGFVVAWYDTRDGHAEIYSRAVSRDGTSNGPERRLTTSEHDAFEADVHAVGKTGFVVGWYERTKADELLPRMGRWSRDGRQHWVVTLSPSGRNTVVRVDGDLIFAAWVQDEGGQRAGVWAGWWTKEGAQAIPARRVADASRTTWNLNAAIAPLSKPDAPRAWIVYDAVSGTLAEELFAAEVSRTDATVSQLSGDDGVSSKYPDVGFYGNRVAVTWFDTLHGNEDVFLVVSDSSALRLLNTLTATALARVTATPGHSIGAYLTWNGDRLGVAWCDDTEGQHEVYIQSFDTSGQPLRPAERVTTTDASSLIPAIQPWGRGFALAWSEYVPGADGHGNGGRGQVAMKLVP